jgi:hypothetical protein
VSNLICKNCIHYDVCGYHIDEETTMTVNECPHEFKHKEQYIKLPAYIGQSIFVLNSKHRYIDSKFTLVDWEVQEGKVSMIQQKADKSWKFRATINSSVGDYTLDEVGKYIFFSEAEAIVERDKRLKELKV